MKLFLTMRRSKRFKHVETSGHRSPSRQLICLKKLASLIRGCLLFTFLWRFTASSVQMTPLIKWNIAKSFVISPLVETTCSTMTSSFGSWGKLNLIRTNGHGSLGIVAWDCKLFIQNKYMYDIYSYVSFCFYFSWDGFRCCRRNLWWSRCFSGQICSILVA